MPSIRNDELKRRFDEGEDITAYMDMSTARMPNQERSATQITLSLPIVMARAIERAASRIGVSSEALINVWLSERLDEEAERVARHIATA